MTATRGGGTTVKVWFTVVTTTVPLLLVGACAEALKLGFVTLEVAFT